jgi:hypothetical protein
VAILLAKGTSGFAFSFLTMELIYRPFLLRLLSSSSMPVRSDVYSQSASLIASLGRSASRNAVPMADEGMDRLPSDDRDVHPHSSILDRGKLIYLQSDQLIP